MHQKSCLDTAVPCFAALIAVRHVDGRRVAWRQVLEQVRELIGDPVFSHWLEPVAYHYDAALADVVVDDAADVVDDVADGVTGVVADVVHKAGGVAVAGAIAVEH